MTKIFIIGYYGLGNIGDEAILGGIISGVQKYIPDSEFTVLTHNPTETSKLHGISSLKHSFKEKKSVMIRNIFTKNELAEIRHHILMSDVVILGGGSLLQDLHIYYLPFFYSFLQFAHRHKKITMIYGIGAGPIDTKIGKILSYNVLNNVDLVTVRDSLSYNVLKACNVKNVIKTADPAFSLPEISKSVVYDIQKTYGLTASVKRISVTAYNWLQDSDIHNNNNCCDTKSLAKKRKIFANICDTIALKYDADILFVPTVLGDVTGYQEIAKNMNENNIILPYSDDYRVAYSAIASTELLIGMRLHSQILATIAGVPIVPISYCGKVKSYLDDINLGEYYLDIEELGNHNFSEKLMNNIDDVMFHKNSLCEHLESVRINMRENSLTPSQLLAKLVGGA